MTNAESYLNYFEEILKKQEVPVAVNPEWVIEALSNIIKADEAKVFINPDWLRAEYEVSFDGQKHSKVPFIEL